MLGTWKLILDEFLLLLANFQLCLRFDLFEVLFCLNLRQLYFFNIFNKLHVLALLVVQALEPWFDLVVEYRSYLSLHLFFNAFLHNGVKRKVTEPHQACRFNFFKTLLKWVLGSLRFRCDCAWVAVCHFPKSLFINSCCAQFNIMRSNELAIIERIHYFGYFSAGYRLKYDIFCCKQFGIFLCDWVNNLNHCPLEDIISFVSFWPGLFIKRHRPLMLIFVCELIQHPLLNEGTETSLGVSDTLIKSHF